MANTDLQAWADNEVKAAQDSWKYYNSIGDQQGMKDAHDRAEYARNLTGYYSSGDGSNLQKIDENYVNNRVTDLQNQWKSNMASGNVKAANDNHAEAERVRGFLNYSGGKDGSQHNVLNATTDWANNMINQSQSDWQKHMAAGDINAANQDHYNAEFARAHLGYSGGANGDQNLNLYNGANYVNDTATPFVRRSNYTGGYNNTDVNSPYNNTSTSGNPNVGLKTGIKNLLKGNTNITRTPFSIGDRNYWSDNTGVYDKNGTLVANGYNSTTGALTYTDAEKAKIAALAALEQRYGEKGWDNILKRLGTNSIPQELINAAMNGTLNSYINTYEKNYKDKQSADYLNQLLSQMQQIQQYQPPVVDPYAYITPNLNNYQNGTAIGNWADKTAQSVSGYPSSSIPSAYGQFVTQTIPDRMF